VEGGGFEPPKLTRQIYSLIPLATREPLRKATYCPYGPLLCQPFKPIKLLAYEDILSSSQARCRINQYSDKTYRNYLLMLILNIERRMDSTILPCSFIRKPRATIVNKRPEPVIRPSVTAAGCTCLRVIYHPETRALAHLQALAHV
jgi:hypothetical protein